MLNQSKQRLLVTGHNGYIGSVMAPHLIRAGYDVTGLDTFYFGDCTLVTDSMPVPSIRRDIRDLVVGDLRGFDAVIHLGALSNDPIGNLRESWTADINHYGSVRLAELARAAGVRRFLFSSSCIMYGVSEASVVNEDSPLSPQTEYARSKVRAEMAISALATDSFSPVFLRNGTVYGVSPRMRFDTVFNDLIASAATTGKVIVFSDGRPWRPVVHVQDVARAFQAVLEAPQRAIHNQAFNTGADSLNYRVSELAKIAVETVPGAALEIRAESSADQRTYKASFSKFARTFPDFRFDWTPVTGACELYNRFREIGLAHTDYTDRRFTRLKWLNYLLSEGRLDSDLRWRPIPEAATA